MRTTHRAALDIGLLERKKRRGGNLLGCMRRMVVKIGGKLVSQAVPGIASDLEVVRGTSEVVVVHGGGLKVTEIAEKLGKKPRFVVSVSGFRSRYTDRDTAEIFEMVMAGKVNKEIVRSLRKASINAVGLAGPDGMLIRARRKEAIKIVEKGKRMVLRGDHTGKIVDVNGDLLELLIGNGYTPVVAPVAIGPECEPLNVDGDRAAANIAGAIKADLLVLLTDVEGVLVEGRLVGRLKGESDIRDVLKRVGVGMKRKIFASLEALEMGVPRAVIASGWKARPVSSALALKGCTLLEK